MFLYEKDYSQSDVDLLEGFFETWLASSGDGRYDDSYDSVDDNKIDLKDWANFVNRAWNLPESNETRFYYLHDALGSVRGMVGGRYKRIDDREFYNYDAYGQPSDLSAVGNPFLFHGKFAITTSPLVLSRFYRDYLPNLGRWMQFDPSGYTDSMNLYEFVYSNPANFVDPWGLWTYEGMYSAFDEKYGDTGRQLLTLALHDGYVPVKRDYSLNDWYYEPNPTALGIASEWGSGFLWLATDDSDSTAADQLYHALHSKYGKLLGRLLKGCTCNAYGKGFTGLVGEMKGDPSFWENGIGALQETENLNSLQRDRASITSQLGSVVQTEVEQEALFAVMGEPLPVVKTKKGVA